MARKDTKKDRGMNLMAKCSLVLVFTLILSIFMIAGWSNLEQAHAASITSCAGCHDYGATYADGTARNVPAGHFQGSHSKHVATYGKVCSVCHVAPATETSADYNHRNGIINMAIPINGNTGAAYSWGTSWAQRNTAFSGGTCSNTYCHSIGTSVSTSSIPVNTSLTWGSGTSNCGSCHGDATGRPNYANNSPKKNSHSVGSHQISCDRCHYATTTTGTTITSTANHVNQVYNVTANPTWTTFNYTWSSGGGSCASGACHGIAQWGVTQFDCVTCHSSAVSSPVAQTLNGSVTQRRAAAGEFANTWSHKRSASPAGSVNKYDCIVCHMEGDPATGGTWGTLHKNGYIDLRDPDTGSGIHGVIWVSNGSSAGAGWYTTTPNDLQFVRFSRNMSQTLQNDPNFLTIAAIQINHCLKCHDMNGAASVNARSQWLTSPGTAEKPFGTTIGGGWYTGYYTANQVRGGVVNVVRSLWTSNAAYHPVLGKANNTYAWGSRMIAPYTAAVTKSWGTLSGANSPWGPLMSCWDCHAATTWSTVSSSWLTSVMTSTVTAHGAPATLRAQYGALGTTSSTNLCISCHASTYAMTSNGHGTGSAFATGGSSMSSSTMGNCNYCHSAYYIGSTNALWATRPIRAENIHGVEDRYPGLPGSVWSTTASKPYSFIRNSLTHWRPLNAPGVVSVGTGQCADTGSGCGGNNVGNGRTYTPGGRY